MTYTFFNQKIASGVNEVSSRFGINLVANIATYVEVTTIMECQISRVILSCSYINCLSCPLNIVIDHTGHMTIAAILDNGKNSSLYKFWYVLKNPSVMVTACHGYIISCMQLLLCDYYASDIQGTVKHSLRGKQS